MGAEMESDGRRRPGLRWVGDGSVEGVWGWGGVEWARLATDTA